MVAMLAFITLPSRFFVVINEASFVMFRSMERWKNAADTVKFVGYLVMEEANNARGVRTSSVHLTPPAASLSRFVNYPIYFVCLARMSWLAEATYIMSKNPMTS